MHIAIVGYGTAGQTLAALLAQDDHHIDVFERAPVLGPVGAGILLQPTGLSVLWQMGLLGEALKYGAPVERLYGDTPAGKPVMDMHYVALDRRLAGLGMQRGALFQILKSAWPNADRVRCAHDIVAISEDGRRLTDDTGATHGPYDLVVIANGAASKLRDVMGEHLLNRPYPWGALWCLLPQGDWPHISDLRQRYRAARRMMGLLPVGSRPDNPARQLSFFWSLPAASVERWRADGLAAWHAEAAALWPEGSATADPHHRCRCADAGQLSRCGREALAACACRVGRRCRARDEPAVGAGGEYGPDGCDGVARRDPV